MKAVAFENFGPPDVLQVLKMPMPTAAPTDVVVEVAAASVNPTDLLLRAGSQAKWMTGLTPPYIPGMEFAGRIHELGDDVVGLAVGQPVMGAVDARRQDGGAQAQYIRVPAASVTPLDESVDLVDAATIPMNGLTAELALSKLIEGGCHSVLVTGGAGVLGGYAIQLAKIANLTVIADGRDDDVDLLRRLGVDIIVPRGSAMTGAVSARFPGGVDGALDAARIGDQVADLVRNDGTFVGVRSDDAQDDGRLRRIYVSILTELGNTASLSRLHSLMQAGDLTPRVAIRLGMHDAPAAHRLVEKGGLRGRVVLQLSRG